MTLIELLVVIVILTTIVGAAIPILSPANDDRRLREAARGVNTFITGAQSRAIATRRPYGILLKRLSQDTQRPEDRGACLEMFYAEQPAPYAGFDASSAARVAAYRPSSDRFYNNIRPLYAIQFVTRGQGANLPSGWGPDQFPSDVIRPLDIIEINGTLYQFLADTNDATVRPQLTANNYFNSNTGYGLTPQTTTIVAVRINNSGQKWAPSHDSNGTEIDQISSTSGRGEPPYWSPPAAYRILRQPTIASDQPYQLPEGAAIDLRASGLGDYEYFYWQGERDNDLPVTIMFSPEGKVERLKYSRDPAPNVISQFDQPVSENLYLLVGKRENIPAPPVDTDPTLDPTDYTTKATNDQQRAKLREPVNWLRGESRWVVIAPLSGRIVTVENAFVDPGAPLDMVVMSAAPGTEFMRAAQILAAREFTRDMRQLGGR